MAVRHPYRAMAVGIPIITKVAVAPETGEMNKISVKIISAVPIKPIMIGLGLAEGTTPLAVVSIKASITARVAIPVPTGGAVFILSNTAADNSSSDSLRLSCVPPDASISAVC